METFADVLHNLIDHVFSGGVADKAHDIIDRASGTRTPPSEPDPAATIVPDAPSDPPTVPDLPDGTDTISAP